MLEIGGSLGILGGHEIIRLENVPTVDGDSVIVVCVVRMLVDRTPFVAEVNFGGYRKNGWQPDYVWAMIEPDKADKGVMSKVMKAVSLARSRGFDPALVEHFVATCKKCRHPSVAAKFREALMLPKSAEVDVSAAIPIAMREGEPRRINEELAMIPQDMFELCLLHGTYVRHDEEPFD